MSTDSERITRGAPATLEPQPEFLSREEAKPYIRSAFGPMERVGVRMLGIRQFLRLQIIPSGHGHEH